MGGHKSWWRKKCYCKNCYVEFKKEYKHAQGNFCRECDDNLTDEQKLVAYKQKCPYCFWTVQNHLGRKHPTGCESIFLHNQ